jgi:glycosyltransferase involved in cell wall biosynthesis
MRGHSKRASAALIPVKEDVLTDGATHDSPVFGFILMGGAHVGATVRDVRLANELARLGYRVHAWWVLDKPDRSDLDPRISQRLLFHAMRYRLRGRPSGTMDRFGRIVNAMTSYRWRTAYGQWLTFVRRGVMHGLLRRVCGGVGCDQALLRSFARQIEQAEITHFLPTLEMFCPFVEAARPLVRQPVKYCVTFQGYEVYANYAREIGLEDALYERIRETVEQSDFPAIVVGNQYGRRVQREIGLHLDQLVTIPPCIEEPKFIPKAEAQALLAGQFPGYRPEVPLVAYLGRQDAEKGIDLLLYATKLCRDQEIDFQLLVCGPTAHGSAYRTACRQIAEHLRIDVLWGDFVSDEVRSAIFQLSDVVTYVSIHDEPFGMVPVEAVAHGATVIIDEKSGARDVLSKVPDAVLLCKAGDTNDLARQIQAALQSRSTVPRAEVRALEASPHDLAQRILHHIADVHPNEWRRKVA